MLRRTVLGLLALLTGGWFFFAAAPAAADFKDLNGTWVLDEASPGAGVILNGPGAAFLSTIDIRGAQRNRIKEHDGRPAHDLLTLTFEQLPSGQKATGLLGKIVETARDPQRPWHADVQLAIDWDKFNSNSEVDRFWVRVYFDEQLNPLLPPYAIWEHIQYAPDPETGKILGKDVLSAESAYRKLTKRCQAGPNGQIPSGSEGSD